MSFSPTDLAAGWTFISGPNEMDQEVPSASLEEMQDQSSLTEKHEDETGSTVDKVNAADLSEELGEEDIPSESESLPSSDVDVLEENVGPDHNDILQLSSDSHTTSFSISNPLEVMSESLNSKSANIATVHQETVELNPEVGGAASPCKPATPLSGVSPCTNSPKDLVELATSAQPLHSSKAPDSSALTKVSQEQGNERQTTERTQLPFMLTIESRFPRTFVREIFDGTRTLSSDMRVLTTYFLLWCAIVVMILFAVPSPNDKKYLSSTTAAHLKSVQDETLKCLGLQHLTAVENNHYGMLLSNVCINDSVAWKANFEKLLKDKVLKPLLNEVYRESSVQRKTEIIEGFMSENRNNVQGIKFDLLLQQMDYLQLLHPADEGDGQPKVRKDSTVADLVSEKLEEQEQLLDQLHQFIDHLKLTDFALRSVEDELKMGDGKREEQADLAALKPTVYRLCLENTFLSNQLQLVLNQFESGEFLNPEYLMESFDLNDKVKNFRSNRLDELMEKVNSLLSANEEFKRMYSHFTDLKNSDGNVFTPKEKEAISKASHNSVENVESLVKELLSLHQSLTDELLEVRKWNEMLAGITDALRSYPKESSRRWTWSDVKHAFDGIFAGAKEDVTERLKNIMNIDVLELIPTLTEEKKPFLKDAFQSFTNFWKDTGTKSKEFIDRALHEMNADFSLSGMFKSFSSPKELSQETVEVPGESEKTDGEVSVENSAEVPSDLQDDLQNENLKDAAVNGGSDHSESALEGDDWDRFKADWLFQRAAERESLRHTAKIKPMNWYLRREQNMWRSPMTKEQLELLEKMEAARYPAFKKPLYRERVDEEL